VAEFVHARDGDAHREIERVVDLVHHAAQTPHARANFANDDDAESSDDKQRRDNQGNGDELTASVTALRGTNIVFRQLGVVLLVCLDGFVKRRHVLGRLRDSIPDPRLIEGTRTLQCRFNFGEIGFEIAFSLFQHRLVRGIGNEFFLVACQSLPDLVFQSLDLCVGCLLLGGFLIEEVIKHRQSQPEEVLVDGFNGFDAGQGVPVNVIDAAAQMLGDIGTGGRQDE